MAERKTKTMKAMIVSNLSFNLVIAMEREMLYYSDQMLYNAARSAALHNDLEQKLLAWGDLAEMALRHQNLHEQILGSLKAVKEEQEELEEQDRESPDKETLVCRFPSEYFDTIARAFNSPFLDLKEHEHTLNYWHQVQGSDEEKMAMAEQHKTLIRCLKSAQPTFVEVMDEDDNEDTISDSSLLHLVTMPKPRIVH